MSYTMSKEKNLVKFLADGKTVPYIFDINTGIFYGLRNQPIKQYPAKFKSWVRQNSNNSAVIHLLQRLFDYPYHYTERWEEISLNELVNYVDLFKCMDKLDSIGYSIRLISDSKTIIEFVNSHFKKFTKAIKENPQLDMNAFYNLYGEWAWRKENNLIPNEHLTEEMIHLMYVCKDSYPIEKTSYVAYYLSHGLLDFFDININDSYYISNTPFQKIKKYFEYCDFLGIAPTKKDFYRSYINVYRTYKIKKLEVDNNTLEEHYKKYPMLDFENENFKVVIPKTTKDFEDEANAQHNCLYSIYFPYVLEEKTNIVFIRRINDINNSLITCEIDNRGDIIQYLKKYNDSKLTAEEKEFKSLYQTHLKNTW